MSEVLQAPPSNGAHVQEIRCTRTTTTMMKQILNHEMKNLSLIARQEHSRRPMWRQASADLTAPGKGGDENVSCNRKCRGHTHSLTSNNPVSSVKILTLLHTHTHIHARESFESWTLRDFFCRT